MKKRNAFSLIGSMLSLIGPYIWLIILAVFVGSLGFLSAMGITFFAGLSIVSYLGEPVAISFAWLIALTLICGFARGGLRYAEQYLNHYMAFSLLARIRDICFASLRKQGAKVLDERSKGDVLSLLQSDVETMEVFYAHTITPFLIAILVESSVLSILGAFCGWQYVLIGLGSYLLIGIISPIFFYLSNRKLGKEYRQALSESETVYLNTVYGVRETLLANQKKMAMEEALKASDRLNLLSRKLNAKAARSAEIINILIAITDIAIIAMGSYLFPNNRMEVLAYAIIAASFGPVVALANLPANLTQSFASARRVLALIEEKPKTEEGNNAFDFASLEVKNLSFSYNGENDVLKNINLSIKKGKIIGIHGHSGAGKSTLLKLLLNFEKPKSGEVLYNGENVASYTRESLSKNVTLFSQSTYLFQGDIAFNLRIARPNATEEELRKACEKAKILDFIESTDKGFATPISVFQDNISTGEKQRIGLARVFLADTPLLLLDEATSNVDAENEAMILNGINQSKADLAVIIISHRESALAICDEIYELEGGSLSKIQSKSKHK